MVARVLVVELVGGAVGRLFDRGLGGGGALGTVKMIFAACCEHNKLGWWGDSLLLVRWRMETTFNIIDTQVNGGGVWAWAVAVVNHSNFYIFMPGWRGGFVVGLLLMVGCWSDFCVVLMGLGDVSPAVGGVAMV